MVTEPQHRGGLSPAFRLDGEAIWVVSKYPYEEWTLGCSEVARGNSLVVQWLGLGAFTAVGPGSIPGQRTKILWAGAAKKKKKKKKLLGIKRQAGLVWLPALPPLLSPAVRAVSTPAQLDLPAGPSLILVLRLLDEVPLPTVTGEQRFLTTPSGCKICCEVKQNGAGSSLGWNQSRSPLQLNRESAHVRRRW